MTTAHRRCPAARHRPWPRCRQCCGVALDIGSSRTRAWIAGRGLVLDVPTVAFPDGATVHPIRRGAILDTPATAHMLDRLLGHRLPRLTRPLVVVATPVLDGVTYRTEARTAVKVLRPRGVLTVPAARAVAMAAGADLSHPQLVVDIGAQLTEVVLLSDGAVTDARRIALGTADLDTVAPARIGEAVAVMVAAMLRPDRAPLTSPLASDALLRGVLLAGGGALRPELVHDLSRRLPAPLRPVPAPHTAAVRGAALLLEAAHAHPSTTGTARPATGTARPATGTVPYATGAVPHVTGTVPPSADVVARPGDVVPPSGDVVPPSADAVARPGDAVPPSGDTSPCSRGTDRPSDGSTLPIDGTARPAHGSASPLDAAIPSLDGTARPACDTALPAPNGTARPAQVPGPPAHDATPPAHDATPPVDAATPPPDGTAPPPEPAG